MNRKEGQYLILILSSRYVLSLEVFLEALLIDSDTRPSQLGQTERPFSDFAHTRARGPLMELNLSKAASANPLLALPFFLDSLSLSPESACRVWDLLHRRGTHRWR